MIIFLTGASGVGKTSIVEKLEQNFSNSGYEFCHFDTIRIPSIEERQLIENWQEKTTHEWIDKLVSRKSKNIIVFEGSSNIKFIISGFKRCDYEDYRIILIDCQEAEIVKRLIENRNQPELANDDMKNWLRYLRNQAKELAIDIIDTTNSNVEDSAEILLHHINVADKSHKK